MKKITLATYAILESINSPLLQKDNVENIQIASFIPTLYIIKNGYQAGLEANFIENSFAWFDKQDYKIKDIKEILIDAANQLAKLVDDEDAPAEVQPKQDVSQPLCAGVPEFKPSMQ